MTVNDMPRDRDRMMVEGAVLVGVPSLFRCPVAPTPQSATSPWSACSTAPAPAPPNATSIWGRNIIGGDVVCLMPTKDQPNKITSLVTAAVMFEMIALIADNAAGA